MMRLYLPEDKLVRVVGEDNNPKYVPLALAPQTAEYDVIVDEAPAGPNQKMQTFQVVTQLMPLLQPLMEADPSLAADFIRYSPLPSALAEKAAQAIATMKQQQEQSAQAQAQKADAMMQAEIAEKQAGANQRNASAQKDMADVEYGGMDKLMEAIKMFYASQQAGQEDQAMIAQPNQDGQLPQQETPPNV